MSNFPMKCDWCNPTWHDAAFLHGSSGSLQQGLTDAPDRLQYNFTSYLGGGWGGGTGKAKYLDFLLIVLYPKYPVLGRSKFQEWILTLYGGKIKKGRVFITIYFSFLPLKNRIFYFSTKSAVSYPSAYCCLFLRSSLLVMFGLTSKEKNMSTLEHLCPHGALWWQWYPLFTTVTLEVTLDTNCIWRSYHLGQENPGQNCRSVFDILSASRALDTDLFQSQESNVGNTESLEAKFTQVHSEQILISFKKTSYSPGTGLFLICWGFRHMGPSSVLDTTGIFLFKPITP